MRLFVVRRHLQQPSQLRLSSEVVLDASRQGKRGLKPPADGRRTASSLLRARKEGGAKFGSGVELLEITSPRFEGCIVIRCRSKGSRGRVCCRADIARHQSLGARLLELPSGAIRALRKLCTLIADGHQRGSISGRA